MVGERDVPGENQVKTLAQAEEVTMQLCCARAALAGGMGVPSPWTRSVTEGSTETEEIIAAILYRLRNPFDVSGRGEVPKSYYFGIIQTLILSSRPPRKLTSTLVDGDERQKAAF